MLPPSPNEGNVGDCRVVNPGRFEYETTGLYEELFQEKYKWAKRRLFQDESQSVRALENNKLKIIQ